MAIQQESWKSVILGLSCGYRRVGNISMPGESNKALARVVDKEQLLKPDLQSILQWEIAEHVLRKPVLVIREHRVKGKHLDSDEVIAQAMEYAKKNSYWVIYLVTHPFLHRFLCKRLFKKMAPDFWVKVVKTGWIPFDKESEQWHTRGPIRCLVYTVLRVLTGRKGR
jgi:hypothetical protein